MRIISMLILTLLSVLSMADPATMKEIKLPDGKTVETNTSTIDSIPQKIRVLTPEELRKISALEGEGLRFVRAYLPGVKNPNLKDYDVAFGLWQGSADKKYTEHEVTDVLGCVLGGKMVAELNMEWVEVTDEYGVDYAVRGKIAEVMSFPFSSVQKRIQKNENEFLYAIYHTVKNTIDSGDYKSRE